MMLGWEYPPRFAGGLGKACQGLAQGLAKNGAQIFFVLPTFPDRLSEPRLEVVGARECMIEAGWDPEAAHLRPIGGWESFQEVAEAAGLDVESFSEKFSEQITAIRSDAVMAPYSNPAGPAPDKIFKMFEESATGLSAAAKGTEAGKKIFKVFQQHFKQTIAAVTAPKAAAPTAAPKPESQAEAPKTEPQAAQKKKKVTGAGEEIYGRTLWSEIERFTNMVGHLADAHEVDVVHAHDWMTFPAAFEFQRRTGTPVFLHVHATEYDRSGENLNNDVFRIEREGFRRATHIFAVSRYTAGIIERLYGVNRRKITVIYNAPEENLRHFVVDPKDKSIKRENRVVFLGRLTFQKGPDHFLRAAQIVAQANKDARFIFCGTGDMLVQLRHQAHRLGIEDRVHFAGFVDPSGVDQILMHSKVLVMPSVSEPFGLVALEAIRCGIPIIISKQSGVREVLHRALQTDFWDHEKLADQMLAALRLPGLSRQLVEEGMDQLQQLSWDRSAAKVIETYQKYIGTTYYQAVEGAHGH
jgi:glycosyltransferase involved in cell wall biosynthesis